MSLWSFIGGFAIFNTVCDLFSSKPKQTYIEPKQPYDYYDIDDELMGREDLEDELSDLRDEIEDLRDQLDDLQQEYQDLLDDLEDEDLLIDDLEDDY